MAEYEGMNFEQESGTVPPTEQVSITDPPTSGQPTVQKPYPDPIVTLSDSQMNDLNIWLDKWLTSLMSLHSQKVTQWAKEEEDYRALSDGPKTIPFEGACGDKIPAIAMAVDPVQARLSTGIFKSDPVFRLKALDRSLAPYMDSMEQFIEFYQRHKIKLRNKCAPRLFEMAKHGTMVLKTIYDRESYNVMTYDPSWKPIKKNVTRFSGPQTTGIDLDDFYFPPFYQFLQDCPIVAERQRLTYGQLAIAESSGKLTNCSKIKGQTIALRDQFEMEQARSVNQQDAIPGLSTYDLYEIFEIWFDYDVNGDGLPEKMVATYHYPTKTFLQLRYNWYFHQKKPYTIIPFTVSADSLYGLGLAEMGKPFQDQLTSWHRLAMDNAYLANIRMFIASKDSAIENRPKLFSGRVFRVDDPKKDLIPFAMADTYPSTIAERQNLFGLLEKRTGVSDYLTGRESPIVGSRATATSTVALINEGTKRVEEVLENVRNGLSEVLEMWISIWIQYGLDDLDRVAFKDEKVAEDIRKFFNALSQTNVNGALAVDLTVSDAANNRVAQQQMQLAIIQVMMGYLQKVFDLGQMVITQGQQNPALADLAKEVSDAAYRMFRDLLQTYNVPNPESYLPDLNQFIEDVQNGRRQPADVEGLIGSITGQQGVRGVPAEGGNLAGPGAQAVGGMRSSFAPTPTRPGEGVQ